MPDPMPKDLRCYAMLTLPDGHLVDSCKPTSSLQANKQRLDFETIRSGALQLHKESLKRPAFAVQIDLLVPTNEVHHDRPHDESNQGQH